MAIKIEIKKKPTFGGVRVSPMSTNIVTFDHKGERCQLHFLQNGNIAISKDSNKDFYIEINKVQLLDRIIDEF
jgi:hypothetical protein